MSKQARLTREQASQMYDQLRKSMEARYGKKGLENLMDKEKALNSIDKIDIRSSKLNSNNSLSALASRGNLRTARSAGSNGMRMAFALVISVALFKTALSAFEAAGVGSVEIAQASMAPIAPATNLQRFSPEEQRLLKTLDARRVELEERNNKLNLKEEEIKQKDREFAVKLTQLRELTEKLKIDRQKDERKQDAQLDQLANVYGSMNPQEAAQLIEQLDVTIGLSLIERMPEKRIGQILALMSPERALAITRMLSGK
jgi:flagellar motility protein MotE (MotC chaperone)